jgi:hypothetical protein
MRKKDIEELYNVISATLTAASEGNIELILLTCSDGTLQRSTEPAYSNCSIHTDTTTNNARCNDVYSSRNTGHARVMPRASRT